MDQTTTPCTSSLQIPPSLAKVIRPHQVDVLHFLWHRLVDEGLYRKSPMGGLQRKLYDAHLGAIIGHSMGLGKTLSALSFLALLQRELHSLMEEEGRLDVADRAPRCPALRVLVLCPRSCVEFWREAYTTWMQPEYFGEGPQLPLLVPRDYNNQTRAEYYIKHEYYGKGGILVAGYEEYLRWMKLAEGPRRLSSTARVRSLLDGLRGGGVGSTGTQCLLLEVLESADVVVFDEAHRLRNQNSELVSQTTRHIRRVPLRLALTGTPLQNHLESYMVMRSVITGEFFDKKRFRSTFVDPINRGQCTDSTYHQFLEMQKCVSSLRAFFNQYVHHCGSEVLEGLLPHRSELVVFTTLSDAQDALYRRVLQEFTAKAEQEDMVRCALALHQRFSHLCLHPWLLQHCAGAGSEGIVAERDIIQRSAARPTCLLVEEGEWVAAASSGEDNSSNTEDGGSQGDGEKEEVHREMDMDKLAAQQGTEEVIDVSVSPKLQLILNLTDYIIHTKKEKVVIFSHYVAHLVFLRRVLETHLHAPADIFCGLCTNAQRRDCIKRFNDDEERRVLLCSVVAGGVGINLSAANHCILTDVSWNPTDDSQATYRVYRFGQTRPVHIYRLATFGTTEQVVFSYALGKSWLHRKVADVADPQRHQRHVAKSYYTYPCDLPLEGDSDYSGTSAETREADILHFCEDHCPDLAVVLQRHPDLHTHVRSVLPHTFLLKDDEKEVIEEMEQKFFDKQDKTEKVPIVIYEKRVYSSSSSHKKWIDASEVKLLQFAQRVVQILTSLLVEHAGDGGRDSGAGEQAVAQLERVMRSLTGICLDDMQLRQRHALNLEYMLRVYVKGVDDLFREKLNTVDYADMRANWLVRLQGLRDDRDGGDLRRHRPLVADLLASVKSHPFAFFNQFTPCECTFIDTELGFSRPFVVETFLRGMRRFLFHELYNPERLDTLRELCTLLAGAGHEDDASVPEVYLSTEGLAEKAFGALEAQFDVIWPAYGGFDLPPLPMNIAEEERSMRRAYVTAHFPMHTGLFRVADAANILNLRLHASNEQRRHSFFCKRCPNTLLQMRAENGLCCPQCHYNVQFEVDQHAACHHQAQLFQLSSVCNKVCGFSLRAALRTCPPPAEAATNVMTLADWLTQNIPTEETPFPFVTTCMQEGVDVLLTQFPSSIIFRLSLQCGTGYDLPLLRRFLLNNSHLLWTSQLQKHVKAEVSSFFKTMMTSSSSRHADLVGMPVMLLLLALYSDATTEQATVCSQLLEQERCDRSIHCALLRYAADVLVRLLYLERLRPIVLAPPPPPSPSASPSVDSELSEKLFRGVPTEDHAQDPPEIQRAQSPFSGQKRMRSPTPCSPVGSPVHSSSSGSGCGSSSFGLRYSADRSSFSSMDSAHSERSAVVEEPPVETEVESSFSIQQLHYLWGAFAAVYGMSAVERGAQMAETLPPPPDGVQPLTLAIGTVNTGMKITEMLDLFFTKLLQLHTLVPLMAS